MKTWTVTPQMCCLCRSLILWNCRCSTNTVSILHILLSSCRHQVFTVVPQPRVKACFECLRCHKTQMYSTLQYQSGWGNPTLEFLFGLLLFWEPSQSFYMWLCGVGGVKSCDCWVWAQHGINWAWLSIPVISASQQEDQKFKVILGYKGSVKPAWDVCNSKGGWAEKNQGSSVLGTSGAVFFWKATKAR